MIITLVRKNHGPNTTIGNLYLNGKLVCLTLEDMYRYTKVLGETRIAAGCYKIIQRMFGGHHEKYKNHRDERIRKNHHGMLWLQNVPDFTDILIHIGNTKEDTKGCILVGTTYRNDRDGDYVIERSTDAYVKVYDQVIADIIAGKEVWITIIDMDR